MRRRSELVEEECCSSESGIQGKRAKCYQSKRVPLLMLLIKSRPRSNRDYERPASKPVLNEPSNYVRNPAKNLLCARVP